jgi:hypothetical protein
LGKVGLEKKMRLGKKCILMKKMQMARKWVGEKMEMDP